jgi:Tfp pilus assembly protein PilP
MNSKEVIKEIRHLLFGDDQKVEMESATLVDGTVIEWEGELAVGTAIFVQTGEGLIPAPDATHEVEGGKLITTEGGLVTEIVEPSEEVAEEMEEVVDVVEEVVTDEAVIEEVAAVVNDITPDEVTAEIATEVAIEVVSQIVDIIDEAPEAEAVVEAMRKIKKMRKSKYSRVKNLKNEIASLKSEISKIKSGFSKTIDLVEKVANLPSTEPTKAPAKLSKKEERFNNILNIAKTLKK